MLGNLKSEKVFDYFEQLSSVPRGSGNNEKIGAYLANFAKERGLSYTMDKAGNVVIRKPATKGFENCDTVVMQGHMDMVCETEEGVEHDFTTQGLDLTVEGDFIKADRTTLGADDGIAIAYGLAILDSDEYEHPALELLVTVDEEIGMLGAAALEEGMITGKKIINVDSEEEGTLLTSCAGGMTALVNFTPAFSDCGGLACRVVVKGLHGGHSGTDIQKFRHNASNVLARMLSMVKSPFHIVSVEGGTADNAITRMAGALLVCDDLDAFKQAWQQQTDALKGEFRTCEPDFDSTCTPVDQNNLQAISREDSMKILQFIDMAPCGVQEMSADMPGLVESSLNMGMLKVNADICQVGFSIRSQKKSYKAYLFHKVADLASAFGGQCQMRGEYPAWDYKPDSKLRDVMQRVYEEQYGKKPLVMGIHAGLECGIFYDRIPGADIVSIGPDTLDIHSPKEKLSISSTRRVFQFLVGVLAAMKEQ